MEQLTRPSERKRVALFALILALVLVASVAFTIVASQRATDAAIESVSEVYLRELSDRVVSEFNAGMENKFVQVETVGAVLALAAPHDEAQAREVLSALEVDDGYAFLALRDESGALFTCDGEKPAEVASEVWAGEDPVVGYRDAKGRAVALSGETIALTEKIDPVVCGSRTFTGVVAGFAVDGLANRLNLQTSDNSSSSSVLMNKEGICLVGCEGGPSVGDDILGAIEGSSAYKPQRDMASVRADLARGEASMVPLSAEGGREYMYFRPMLDGAWYLCTAMPDGVVDGDIEALSGTLLGNAVAIGAVLALVVGASFLVYFVLTRRSTRLLAEEKNRAEAAFEQARQASMAKTEFLSRMSHEIRTPMNGIMGMTAIALRSIGDDEKVRVCLEKVALSSDHLLSLINDILDMSKIESGKIEIKHEEFDLSRFVSSLDAVFTAQAAEHGIDYRTEVDAEVPTCLVGDPLRLNQVIYNLLGNALKFTPEGGRVTLHVERVREEGEPERAGVRVRFSVTDTGCGISPEFMQRIFESFEQGDAHAQRGSKGTGLGLAITKRLVELMGGRISVCSVVGSGSTFVVDVPFEVPGGEGGAGSSDSCGTFARGMASVHPMGIDAEEVCDLTGVHVLVAEDNELNREIALELMAMAGAQADAATTGREAVERFAESPEGYYDVVLMDLQMPEMDGCEAARTIRSMHRADASQVIILAMTADAFTEDEERSRASGMDGHLSKPLAIHRVYATIDRFLQERRQTR